MTLIINAECYTEKMLKYEYARSNVFATQTENLNKKILYYTIREENKH